jgi:uncharacterized membrane protein YtjA (UPF0391 family)
VVGRNVSSRRERRPFLKENAMTLLGLAVLFFIIALVAWAMGARGMAGMSAGIGRILLFVFLVLTVIMAIIYFVNAGHPV